MSKSLTALVLIDFINEIVHPKGKLSGKGYAAFCDKHRTLRNAAYLLELARQNAMPVIHVRVGFSETYREQPVGSPLFGGAKKFGALQLGAWGTEFIEDVAPIAGETIIVKHRVSAFHGSSLDLILRNAGVASLWVVGVSTDLAVQSAAKDAHDRDYRVTVVADACAAADEEDHDQALRMMSKIATVSTLDTLGAARTEAA